MDAAVTSTAMSALVSDGILAGLSLDKVIVQLPARRRIGVTAYAAYALAADLGNGIASTQPSVSAPRCSPWPHSPWRQAREHQAQ